jgi:hypothetical protein
MAEDGSSDASSGPMNIKFWQSLVLQVVAAVVVLLAVFWTSRLAVKGEEIVKVPTKSVQRSSVDVAPGVIVSSQAETVFQTTAEAHEVNHQQDFVLLPRSIDTDGGAQFTYSFWIKVNSSDQTNVFDKILLLRGDKSATSFKNTKSNAVGDLKQVLHPVAFCPMVRAKFDSSLALTITAQFNASSEYNNVVQHTIQNGSSYDVNKYHLVCVSCSDGEKYGQERGVRCRVWYDLLPIERFFKDRALRENGGNLYINPKLDENAYPKTTGNGTVSMRNLRYHNYAFESQDVSRVMQQEGTMATRPYVPTVAPDNNTGYMDRALRLQEQDLSW